MRTEELLTNRVHFSALGECVLGAVAVHFSFFALMIGHLILIGTLVLILVFWLVLAWWMIVHLVHSTEKDERNPLP